MYALAPLSMVLSHKVRYFWRHSSLGLAVGSAYSNPRFPLSQPFLTVVPYLVYGTEVLPFLPLPQVR